MSFVNLIQLDYVLLLQQKKLENMTTKAAYVEVEDKKYKLINIIPSNAIKCAHCDVYVPNGQLQSHSKTHIAQKYSHALQKELVQNKDMIKKINLNTFLEEQNNYQDISIKSILPEEMPKVEVLRKKIALKSTPISEQAWPGMYKNEKISQGPDTIINSVLEASIRHPEIPEERFQLRQQINLECVNMKIDYKNVNYYNQKAHVNEGWRDNLVVQPAKNKIEPEQDTQQEKQNINVYVIESISQKKKKDSKNSPFTIQIKTVKRTPKVKQKIGTISTATSGSGFFRASQVSPSTNTASQFDLNAMKIQKFECSQCKGFYCKTCGSDIPPIYRPAGRNESYLQANQESKQFYNKIYSNQSHCKQSRVKQSRLTGCTNCE